MVRFEGWAISATQRLCKCAKEIYPIVGISCVG
jgi:hypothetical protein